MTYKQVNILSCVCLAVLFYLSASVFFIVLGLWIALSLLAVTAAYKFNWAMLFRKKKNGVIPPAIRWIFTPYLCGVTLYNVYIKSRDRVPVLQKIVPHLYVGARLRTRELDHMESVNIRCVLDLTAEFDGLGEYAEESDIDYLNIPVLDHSLPKLHQLIQACRWIDTHIKHDRAVLVHCALGRGRSVMVVAAYLLASRKAKGIDEALTMIKGIRSTANLNKRQYRALKLWCDELQQSTLVKEQVWLIANPVAGGGQWQHYKTEIIDRLSHHYELNVKETTPHKGAIYWAEKALEAGAQTILVSGGDGTVGEVADVVCNTSCTLGVIPLGTANALSHVLVGWQSKLLPVYSACEAIENGHIRNIDTAVCNGERMLLAMGIGIEAAMIGEATRERKDKLGQLAYIDGFFRALTDGEEQILDLQFDGGAKERVYTNSLMVANAAPLTTILAQGKGNPNYSDGFLDVTWLPARSGSSTKDLADDLISIGALAISGLYEKPFEPHVAHRRVKKIQISSPHALHYVIDGETKTAQTINIELEHKSLQLFGSIPEDAISKDTKNKETKTKEEKVDRPLEQGDVGKQQAENDNNRDNAPLVETASQETLAKERL